MPMKPKRKTKREDGVLQVRLEQYHLLMFNRLLKKYKVKVSSLIQILITEEFHRLEMRNVKVVKPDNSYDPELVSPLHVL